MREYGRSQLITSAVIPPSPDEKAEQRDGEHSPFPLPFSSSCKEKKQIFIENNQFSPNKTHKIITAADTIKTLSC